MFTAGLLQDSSGSPEPTSEGLRTKNPPRLTPETRRVKTAPHAPTLHGTRCRVHGAQKQGPEQVSAVTKTELGAALLIQFGFYPAVFPIFPHCLSYF